MNDIKVGVVIERDGEPFEVLSANHFKIAQRRPVMQTKIKSLKTGKVLSHTFQQSDKIPEADVTKNPARLHHRTRDHFFFQNEKSKMFDFGEDKLGGKTKYLKNGMEVRILFFKDEPILVELPIKVVLRVKDAPPSDRGNTRDAATKEVMVETGASIKTPLFVNTGDDIEVNTQTGDYVRRVNT